MHVKHVTSLPDISYTTEVLCLVAKAGKRDRRFKLHRRQNQTLSVHDQLIYDYPYTDSAKNYQADAKAIDSLSPHAHMPSHFVFRALGLPMDATPSDFQELRRFLQDGEELNLIDEAIVPSCPPGDTLTGLFGVQLPLPSFLDKQTSGSTSAIFAFSLRGEDVEIDRNFLGLTQLYPTEPAKPIVAE